MWLGQSDVAIEHLARAMRLSPLDPRIPDVQTATAHAHFIAGRYDEASSWAEKALAEAIFAPALRVAAASNALAGRLGHAQKSMTRLRELYPTLRGSNLRDRLPPLRPEHFARPRGRIEESRVAGVISIATAASGAIRREAAHWAGHPVDEI